MEDRERLRVTLFGSEKRTTGRTWSQHGIWGIPDALFKSGEVYNRRGDLHRRFVGQRQGGISTPADYPLIFLFTSEQGSEYGYRDEFRLDGTFWYTGEGQEGDMEMTRGNRAIRGHQENGDQLHLFEAIGNGNVRYIGEATYLDHHREDRPDAHGDMRRAIVFELAVDPITEADVETVEEAIEDYDGGKGWTRDQDELRKIALQKPRP